MQRQGLGETATLPMALFSLWHSLSERVGARYPEAALRMAQLGHEDVTVVAASAILVLLAVVPLLTGAVMVMMKPAQVR